MTKSKNLLGKKELTVRKTIFDIIYREAIALKQNTKT